MAAVYACTHVLKTISRDHYETGADLKSECTMDDNVVIVADSLPGLIKTIGDRYGLAMDDLFLSDEGDDISSFGFNRLENADWRTPTPREMEAFRNGTPLWLADYSFLVEAREVRPIHRREFAHHGIVTH